MTYYIIGEARTHTDNAITKIYNSFYMAFTVDAHTGEIYDFGCTHTIDITERFLAELFIGQDLGDDESICRSIHTRYFGTSKRAVIAAYHDALKKYGGVKEGRAGGTEQQGIRE